MEVSEVAKIKIPYFKIWLAFFIYTASVSFLIQFVGLPYIFPAWHAGHGLLVGGDWLGFHDLAVQLVAKIQHTGWSAWQLRPQGQAPAGIAAAIYVITGISEPWTVIPFNAVLHATSALILMLIIQQFLPDWRYAILTVLPLLLFPSSMEWYSQLHKDGLFILGSLLFLYGWIMFCRYNPQTDGQYNRLLQITWIFTGAGLVWLVRPYGAQMLQVLSIILIIIIVYNLIRRRREKSISRFYCLTSIVLSVAITFSLSIFTSTGISLSEVPQPVKPQTSGRESQQTAKPPESSKSGDWRNSGWLPGPIENSLYTLAQVRNGSADGYPDATTNIDTDIRFRDAMSILKYFPRALEISLLAPFPNQWFTVGSLPVNTVMKRIAALEMTAFYLSMVFIFYAFWHWRKRPETWILGIFSLGMIMTFVLVLCNIGSLYRVRYGFLMTLMAFGLAGLITIIDSHMHADGKNRA